MRARAALRTLLLAWTALIFTVWAGMFIGLYTWRQPQGCPPDLREAIACADAKATAGVTLYLIAAFAAAVATVILTWKPMLRWVSRLGQQGGQR